VTVIGITAPESPLPPPELPLPFTNEPLPLLLPLSPDEVPESESPLEPPLLSPPARPLDLLEPQATTVAITTAGKSPRRREKRMT
jgi:hypothetical protein